MDNSWFICALDDNKLNNKLESDNDTNDIKQVINETDDEFSDLTENITIDI